MPREARLALLGEPLAARDRIAARRTGSTTTRGQVGCVHESEDRTEVTIDVAVEEGPQALLAEVRFEGATRDETELADAARIETGNPTTRCRWRTPSSASARSTRARLRERAVQPRLEPRDTDLDLVLLTVEGRRQFVGDVVFEGLRRTREATVRRVPSFRRATRLDPRALTVLERRLLDLNVFRRAAATASPDENATITVQLREQGPTRCSTTCARTARRESRDRWMRGRQHRRHRVGAGRARPRGAGHPRGARLAAPAGARQRAAEITIPCSA